MKNKKGDEKIMSVWWFFVIVIVAGGTVFGVIIYFGADIDTRGIESRTLGEKINGCLTEGSEINDRILQDSFDLFSECNLNEELFGEGSSYYVRIRVLDENENAIGEERHYGQRSFESDCIIAKNLRKDNFAKCSFLKTYLMNDGERVTLEIMSASDQKGRKNTVLQ